jgi:myo-inositol-1(or 4)-monophosphatase
MAALEPEALIDIGRRVAREAAELVLSGFRSRPSYQRKSSYADLVTQFDLASERLIRARLAELSPGITVVGEEEGGSAGEGPAWFADPIDGTVNFAHGHPFFAVSLGLMQRGVPLLGTVVAPALQVEWHAIVGQGAFRNDSPCRVSDSDTLADSLLATGISPVTRFDGHPENNMAAISRVTPAVRDIRRCGSAALDLCMVADGTYEAYWERRLSAWDVAAGAALVLAADGRITDLLGQAYDLTHGYIIASNGRVHDALVELVRPDGAPTARAEQPA